VAQEREKTLLLVFQMVTERLALRRHRSKSTLCFRSVYGGYSATVGVG
jgi:hypothetical protein